MADESAATLKAPCVAGCGLPGRYSVTAMSGTNQGTVCGRHISHVLDLMTRTGHVMVGRVAGRNYR